jgi:O-antigen ligase
MFVDLFFKIYNGFIFVYDRSFLCAFFKRIGEIANDGFFVGAFKKIFLSDAPEPRGVFIDTLENFTRAKDGSVVIKLIRKLKFIGDCILDKKITSPVIRGCFIYKFFERGFLTSAFGMFIVIFGAVPHGSWNNVYIALAFVFFAALYLIETVLGKRSVNIRNVDIPLLLFAFFGAYGVVVAHDVSDAFRIFLLFFSSIGLGVLTALLITDKKTLDFFLNCFLAAVFITSVYGAAQRYFGIEIRSEFIDTKISSEIIGRVFSTMDNPNNYAEYLLLLTPLLISKFFNEKNEAVNIINFIVIAAGLYALIYTLSRGAYAAFMFGALIYVVILNPKLLPLGAILAVAVIPILPDFIINRFTTIGRDSSSAYRVLIWNGSLRALKDYWLSGAGMGPVSFKHVFGQYADPLARRAMHSHNLFLQLFFDTGFGGALSFAAFLIFYFRKLFSALKTKSAYLKNLLGASFFAVGGILAFGMVEYVWFYPRVLLTFWIVVGFSLGVVNVVKKEKQKAES